jgi:hypothetical protein
MTDYSGVTLGSTPVYGVSANVILNTRWPRTLIPKSCTFGRTRNDVIQVSPASRQTTVIRRGRPLWTAKLTWEVGADWRGELLRYWLEGLDGANGSVQIWDFHAQSIVGLPSSVTQPSGTQLKWSNAGTVYSWTSGGTTYSWTDSTLYGLSGSVSLPTAQSAAAIGAYSLQVNNLPASVIVAFQGGYVQIGRRLYTLASNAATDTTGSTTITVQQSILSAVSAGDPIRFVEAACEMRLMDQNFDAAAQAGEAFRVVTASFIETASDAS